MSVTCRVTGNISQPVLRQLDSGSVVLNAGVLRKGSKVCVEGILVRKEYEGRTNLELFSPFFIESVSLSAHTDSNSDPWSVQENDE